MGRRSKLTVDDVIRSLDGAKVIQSDLVKLRKHLLLAVMKIDRILKETK